MCVKIDTQSSGAPNLVHLFNPQIDSQLTAVVMPPSKMKYARRRRFHPLTDRLHRPNRGHERKSPFLVNRRTIVLKILRFQFLFCFKNVKYLLVCMQYVHVKRNSSCALAFCNSTNVTPQSLGTDPLFSVESLSCCLFDERNFTMLRFIPLCCDQVCTRYASLLLDKACLRLALACFYFVTWISGNWAGCAHEFVENHISNTTHCIFDVLKRQRRGTNCV